MKTHNGIEAGLNRGQSDGSRSDAVSGCAATPQRRDVSALLSGSVELDELRNELKGVREMLRRECVDWAEDHTYAQTVAKRIGVPEEKVEGDRLVRPGPRCVFPHMPDCTRLDGRQGRMYPSDLKRGFVPKPGEHVEAFSPEIRRCEWCGLEFVANWVIKKYCCACCRDNRASAVKYRKKRAALLRSNASNSATPARP